MARVSTEQGWVEGAVQVVGMAMGMGDEADDDDDGDGDDA
jgi:hypothetical protein